MKRGLRRSWHSSASPPAASRRTRRPASQPISRRAPINLRPNNGATDSIHHVTPSRAGQCDGPLPGATRQGRRDHHLVQGRCRQDGFESQYVFPRTVRGYAAHLDRGQGRGRDAHHRPGTPRRARGHYGTCARSQQWPKVHGSRGSPRRRRSSPAGRSLSGSPSERSSSGSSPARSSATATPGSSSSTRAPRSSPS